MARKIQYYCSFVCSSVLQHTFFLWWEDLADPEEERGPDDPWAGALLEEPVYGGDCIELGAMSPAGDRL